MAQNLEAWVTRQRQVEDLFYGSALTVYDPMRKHEEWWKSININRKPGPTKGMVYVIDVPFAKAAEMLEQKFGDPTATKRDRDGHNRWLGHKIPGYWLWLWDDGTGISLHPGQVERGENPNTSLVGVDVVDRDIVDKAPVA